MHTCFKCEPYTINRIFFQKYLNIYTGKSNAFLSKFRITTKIKCIVYILKSQIKIFESKFQYFITIIMDCRSGSIVLFCFFLKWQPCHFPVLLFCLFRVIYLGFCQCSFRIMLVVLSPICIVCSVSLRVASKCTKIIIKDCKLLM